MAQGYYNLQEAAQFLELSPDELKHMAQKKEIRSFQDRGTLRFRVQDVQEMGRRRGTTSSDPDLILNESISATPMAAPKSPTPRGPKTPSQLGPKSPSQAAPKSPSPHGPKTPSGPRTPTKEAVAGDASVFEFSLDIDDGVGIGKELLADLSGGSKKSGPSGKTPQRSPHPKPASDSGVHLVTGGTRAAGDSDVRLIGHDSDVKLSDASAKTPRVARHPDQMAPSPTPKKGSKLGVPQPDSSPHKNRPPGLSGTAQPADSGVRLVPMDSDSDVKIVGAGSDEISLGDMPPMSTSDSDIRLDKYTQPVPDSGEGELNNTEEINLDEEIRKQEAALQQPKAKLKPKSKLKLPPASPADSSDFDLTPAGPHEDSSEFDLTPAGDGSALVEPDASDDFSLELSPDDSALGGEMSALSGPSSGISLNNPVDAGISLEEGDPAGSDVDFDLSLEVETTPKPAPSGGDSDSEFELTLDTNDSGKHAAAAQEDSEFELTLDDTGGLAPMESDAAASDELKPESQEKDIFETDFEVPALEDDSGSHVAPLDTDLDSSDFDIALDDSAVEDESASQVVALDDEADAAATTRSGDEDIEVEVDEGEGFGDLEVSEDGEEGALDVDDAKTVVKEKLVQPAPWGALPVVFMLPCVIVMVLVGILGLELIQTGAGYKSPGMLTKAISGMIGQPIK